MKVLLLLAIFCAVSYASISPKWIDVNEGKSTNFNWTEVTAQSAPVKGQWNTINYCGVAHDNLNYTYIRYAVGVNSNTQPPKSFPSGTVKFLGDKASFAGVPFCEFLSFQLPQFDGSEFHVVLHLYAFDKTDTYYDS